MDATVRSTILGAGIGAGAMFLLDPARGSRRRALIRDKVVRVAHKGRDAYEATRRDLENRVTGAAAELRGRFSSNAADDETICERVRAEVGRATSHPRAIHVAVADRCVILTGQVLASEASSIVSAARAVRGVASLENRLAVRATADGIPALQDHSRRPGRWATLVRRWSPPTMLIAGAGAVATAVATLGLKRHERRA